ncbi:hypothetical protein [Mucilaginibacter lacusdianchii]|uniref:hypothetical protein n=1 Tax=Mucilaginibacter lacusdianchii TaxID=2684211 RepID=UPI00131B02B7|nr:hypothetical protein [Mucilaginibacter sp. JXJ CY 39]
MISTNQLAGSDFNTQVYQNTHDAAVALAAPFVTANQPNTVDEYSYVLYSAEEMKANFGISDLLWQNGGPVLGFNTPNQNYVATTDCSGFVARVLYATIPLGAKTNVYASLVTAANGTITNYQTPGHQQPFPSADDFAEWFALGAKHNLEPVAYTITKNGQLSRGGAFSAVKPGDILAYGLPAGSKDTGHVMIVDSVEKLQRGVLNAAFWSTDLAEFIQSGLQFYAVTVFDSSNVAHHNDQRGNGEPKPTGIGRGTVLVVADEADTPIGFMFAAHDLLLQVQPITVSLPASATGTIGSLAVGRVVGA